MFNISYKKNNNDKLFSNLGPLGFSKIQNYIPIYGRFFSLNDKTYNNINLNHKYSIKDVKEKKENNIFIVELNDEKQKTTKLSFFKFSPLMDPVKYMVGKYENVKKEMRTTLPKLNDNIAMKKILDVNNSAYVDSFF